jgi:hypothetical protein
LEGAWEAAGFVAGEEEADFGVGFDDFWWEFGGAFVVWFARVATAGLLLFDFGEDYVGQVSGSAGLWSEAGRVERGAVEGIEAFRVEAIERLEIVGIDFLRMSDKQCNQTDHTSASTSGASSPCQTSSWSGSSSSSAG